MNRESRNTKIVATLGPATSEKEKIRALAHAGVNVFRINFSHTDHETFVQIVTMIRALEEEHGDAPGIMADLQGPKLRIGTFADDKVALSPGQTFRFDLDETPGDSTRVCLPHPAVLKVLEPGHRIFLDDGKVRAEITRCEDDYVEAVIKSGTCLSSRKGLNVPGIILTVKALTDKDKADLDVALQTGVDWVAQSFVQTAADVEEARALIGDRAGLMVKLEKPAALDDLDGIMAPADGIMLARGDLGVEIPPEDVPAVQKRVVRAAREAGKPVVVATQMLESMIESARPTRAEASDVATAVYDGTDAVMLSGETAMGAYPLKAVEIMDRICRRTEADETYDRIMDQAHPETNPDGDRDPSDAITAAAYYVVKDVNARFIVTYTHSGATALRMARQRPHVPILCLTPHLSVARRLTVSYGVNGVHAPETAGDFTGPARHAAKIAQSKNIAQPGDLFVMTAGVPFGVKGSTNLLRVSAVT